MKSLKNIAPLLIATNPAAISAFSVLSNGANLPDVNKNQGQETSGFVSKEDARRKKWGFLDGLEDDGKNTQIDKKDNKSAESKDELNQGMVCKDGVCYLSFDDEDKSPVKEENNQLFVVEESSSFVSNYNKTKDSNQGLKR